LSIGDFSRMTYLSVKALRHYHDVGLLEPAQVDPTTGYRFYDAAQVPTAQVIRRFRDLGMPLEQVKAVLDAPDVVSRNEVIVAHLRRMESQLQQTQTTVSSLRALLEHSALPISVEYRSVPPTRSLAISEPVGMDDIEDWWSAAFEELYGVLRTSTVKPSGPGGALYPNEFFEVELGEVTAFVPVADEAATSGRVRVVEIPAAELAVTVHHGPFSDLDQTYGALGTYVAARELGVEGPIREYYLLTSPESDDEAQHRTEVGWPVFHTTPLS
ncbi:MAG TPA: MerR family transcriptional regulator, partial [Acidimicrobiales bacterium]|nr:MerR family transcriptional regulator [Acidimicrobiales bacterium]